MKKTDEQMLRKVFTSKFTDIFRKGLLQGGNAMCKVIYDKAINIRKTPEERIEDIKRFCEVSLGDKK